MTTKELEKKLKISNDTCIHCPTLELAKQVLSIFHQLGLKWCSENHYIRYTNWDSYRENTIYYPFDGKFSFLKFAHLKGYKIISAEEFIALHTEEEKFDSENYIPKGGLEGFPKEIIARMLECQEEQGNPRDISVFEKLIDAGQCIEGFDWDETQEDCDFWHKVITNKDFNLFFEKYPKKDDLENYIPKGELEGFPKEIIARMLNYQEEQWGKINVSVFEKDKTAGEPTKGFVWGETKEGYDFWNEIIRYENFALFFARYPKKQEYQESKTAKYVQVGNNAILSDITSTQSSVEINTTEEDSQGFRVGDEVIDIILNLKGKITNVKSNGNLEIQFEGESSITEYNLKIEKRPSLLHYRDDYDYDVIDFNNLPKRQEVKRWRAENGGVYHFICFKIEGWFYTSSTKENNHYYDNIDYNSGNYFQTKEKAQEVADKLNKCFQELINPNK